MWTWLLLLNVLWTLRHSLNNLSYSRTKINPVDKHRPVSPNLLVFFGHPLVPTVEHIQPFGFSLPEHVWRNIITASRENKKRLDHLSDISACKDTHTYKFTHVRKYRVGNREPVLVQNRCSWRSVLLTVMVHLICVFKKYYDSVFCNAIKQQRITAIESTMAVLINHNNPLPHWTGQSASWLILTWLLYFLHVQLNRKPETCCCVMCS